jgi:ApaG protein
MGFSKATTLGITVEVRSSFLPERSDPRQSQYFFTYQIAISNEGDVPARLVARHWLITDGHGRIEHVQGPGVVGKQPRLLPGERHEYQSFCPLPTAIGAMRGTYRMIRDDGTAFDAEIAEFALEVPDAIN